MPDDGFAAFYAGSYRRLLGQLFAVTGDLGEAENVLQEAYARAFVRWSRVRDYDLPEAWVRRVALNLAKVTPPLSPETIPAAFHVALDRPGRGRVGELHLALCGSRKTGACPGGLVVLEHPRG